MADPLNQFDSLKCGQYIVEKQYRGTVGRSAKPKHDVDSFTHLEYTARASVTRAFWPPLSVTPFSPTSVSSPASNKSKSRLSAHW